MLNRDKTKLRIFSLETSFEKISREKNKKNENVGIQINFDQPFVIGNSSISNINYEIFKKINFKDLFFNPKKFFKNIKSKKQALLIKLLETELNGIEKIQKDAERIYQQAFLEKLEKEKERIKRESYLAKTEISTFIEEKDVVYFCQKSCKNIKLDWIKNFSRQIPKENKEKIELALSLKIVENDSITHIFDNIVIMHYDPKDNASSMTNKEKERAKDPIAFGVMECSTRLYFITDWIDEFCDLTFDKLLETIGKKQEFLAEENIKISEAKI